MLTATTLPDGRSVSATKISPSEYEVSLTGRDGSAEAVTRMSRAEYIALSDRVTETQTR